MENEEGKRQKRKEEGDKVEEKVWQNMQEAQKDTEEAQKTPM